MRPFIVWTFCLCLSFSAYGQFGKKSELFKVQDELVVREGNQFFWHKNNEVVYLGNLLQIPSGRMLEYSERGTLLNSLLVDFLDEVITKAKTTQRDSVFRNGFIINDKIKAIGAQHGNEPPFHINIGKNLVRSSSTQNEDNAKTLSELFEKIASVLNKIHNTDEYKFDRIRYITSGKFKDVVGYFYNLKKGERLIFATLLGSHPIFSEEIEIIVNKTSSGDYHSFVKRLLVTPNIFKQYNNFETNSSSVISGHHISVDVLLTTENKDNILNGLKSSTHVTVNVEKEKAIIKNLEQARDRGQYTFIVDYLNRVVSNPFPKRDILYLEPDEPIFVQDSVLDIYSKNEFKTVSDKPIDTKYKEYVLPELLHRVNNDLETYIDGKITPIGSHGVAYQFKGEDFHVVALRSVDEKITNFFYIMGWSEVQDKESLVALLSKSNGSEFEREAIELKKIKDQLLLIVPEIDEFLVDTWNPENGSRKNIAALPRKGLTNTQRSIVLAAIIDRVNLENKDVNDCIPVFHDPTTYAESRQLLFSFENEKDILYAYEEASDGTLRQLRLVGEKYHATWNDFYKAMLRQNELTQKVVVTNVDGDPFVIDDVNKLWAEVNKEMKVLTIFNEQRSGSFLRNKVMKVLKQMYVLRPELSVIKYWAANNKYVAIEYPEDQRIGLISGAPFPQSFLPIEGYSSLYKDEKISELILKKTIEGTFERIAVNGNENDKAWSIRFDEAPYLITSKKDKLYDLGKGYTDTEASQSRFLEHLSSLIETKEILNIAITKMSVENDVWMFALEESNNRLRVFSTLNNRSYILEGTLPRDTYFNEKEYATELRKEFENEKLIYTEVVDGVRVSEAEGQFVFWNNEVQNFHKPTENFPAYFSSQQRRTIIDKLVALFKGNTSFSIEASNSISNREAYGLYNSENKSLLIIPNTPDPQIVEINNTLNDISLSYMNVLLDNTLIQEKYRLDELGNVMFLKRKNQELIKLSEGTSGVVDWKVLGSVKDLNPKESPQLYSTLLLTLHQNTSINKLEAFHYYELKRNDVALWKKDDSYQTIILERTTQNFKNVIQKQHLEIEKSQKLLDIYFTEILNTDNIGNIETLRLTNDLFNFYNRESERYFFTIGDGNVKLAKIKGSTFNDIKESNNNLKEDLFKTLYKYHTDTPRISFKKIGFYYYYNNRIIFRRKNMFGNQFRKIKVNRVKSVINQRILDQRKQILFSTTNTDVIVRIIFDAVIKEKNYCSENNLQGSECFNFVDDLPFKRL